MLKENLQFAVSSTSCAEYRMTRPHQIAIPRFATKAIVNRASQLKETLEPVFGLGNVGVSLHLARVIDIPRAVKMLKRNSVPITSIDTPDIYPVREFLEQIIENLRTRSVREILLNIGFSLHNVSSEEQCFDKLQQALRVKGSIPETQIVRTNAKVFLDSTLGDKLRKELNKHKNVALAVEIDASRQTPADYLNLIHQLLSVNERTPVCLDLDLGHLGESKFLHPNHEIPEPLEVLERIFQNPRDSRLLAIVTLNQYEPGARHTHTNLIGGPIDLAEATRKIGEAAKHEKLTYNPTVLAEFYPFEFDLFISSEGLAFCQRLRTAYDSARFSPNL